MTPHRDEHLCDAHRCGFHRCDGFTLLELMAVMGVISVLMGIGIGFLAGKEDRMDVAYAILRDKVRVAFETARATGRSTSVELYESSDGESQFLRARVLSTVGYWHLERVESSMTGIVVEDGRFGSCMRPDPSLGTTMFSLSTRDDARFQIRDGFSLRLELYMEARERCIVAQMGSSFELSLDEDLVPVARLRLRDTQGPRAGRSVDLVARGAELPLDKWTSLVLEHDGSAFRILVDGEVVAETEARGEVYQNRQRDSFDVSPDSGLVPGKIDEIQLLAYEFDQPMRLPRSIEIRGMKLPIRFDRRGNLQRPVTIELILDEKTERRTVAPGGVLK